MESRAGLAGGRAQSKDSCSPALTHPSWVNIRAGRHESASNLFPKAGFLFYAPGNAATAAVQGAKT
jgi:hypothetical protein